MTNNQMNDIFELSSERISVSDSIEAINRLFYARGWTDGLPIIPPTEERVMRMLKYTDTNPGDLIALLPPKRGKATVEKIAINSVMAGCLPQFLPIIITAVKAMAEPEFNLYGIQTTTHVCTPLIIVNGPIIKEVGLNTGYNCFGQGTTSNATIGRAIRLILLNIGGGIPGVLDKATFGHPGKFSYCVGENEEKNPWEPLNVERGFSRDTSTVTVLGAEAPHNIQDHDSTSAEGILTSIAGTMATLGSNSIHFLSESALVLGPEHTETIAKEGLSKDDVREYIYRNARIPLKKFSKENIEWYKKNFPQLFEGKSEEAMVPLCLKKEDIIIFVCGGAGKHSLFIPTFGVTRSITVPITFKDGTPVKSIKVLKRD